MSNSIMDGLIQIKSAQDKTIRDHSKPLAHEYETKERELFGQDGFEKMVARVAQLEQQTGIYDLNQFTPAVSASQARSR